MSEYVSTDDPADKAGSSASKRPTKKKTPAQKAKAAKYMREWQQKNPRAYLNIVLKKLYKITLDEYEAMLDAQGGVWAICQETCKTGRRLCVDHNHDTGEIRGLLCSKCNTAIGMLRDRPALVDRAFTYLGKQVSQ